MSQAPSGMESTPLQAYLASRCGEPMGPDEVRTLLLPLFEQTRAAHERGQVAPLCGLSQLFVTGQRAWYPEAQALAPKRSPDALQKVDRARSVAFEVTAEICVSEGERDDQRVLVPGEPVVRPGLLPGWVSWEHELRHHDPLTDIFSLGMLLGAAALGMDLGSPEALARFAEHRDNLFTLHPGLHPVLAKLIARATEPSRRRRAQDLPGLMALLDHYREHAAEARLDLRELLDRPQPDRSPRQVVQARLRERLFEISRRNRLLYFKPTLQSLNLTVSSVPLQLDVAGLSPDALCTWSGSFEKELTQGDAIPLGRYLRFEDAPYASGILDQIRSQDRRNRTDYGFSQLRLILAFLDWHNLKDEKEERIHSPLLLLPVTLEKRKGVRDSWILRPQSTQAEVNPTLAHHLQSVYGLSLPATLDLTQTPVRDFHARLAEAISASEPAVTLRLLEKPQLKLVQAKARASLERYQRRLAPTGRGLRRSGDVDYSYSRDNFQPLGLQLFLKKVKPAPFPERELVERAPAARGLNVVAPVPGTDGVVERRLYQLETERARNPYDWELDLCSVTLANLNYRRMSLVRDYDRLLSEDTPNPAFDAVFSTEPRATPEPPPPPAWPGASTHVVAADPAQVRAISRAHSAHSYVIQGPPGTGKSQTITNLIADHLRHGKRVLFVCEKRAALDVVFYRLKQRGLSRLCCLIHDVQDDKRPFITELKETYEAYLANPGRLAEVEAERSQKVFGLEQDLTTVARFCQAMGAVDPRAGLRLRELYARLIALGEGHPEVGEAEAETLPPYALWTSHGAAVRTLAQTLEDAGQAPIFARHPLRWLAPELAGSEQPLTRLQAALEVATPGVRELARLSGLALGVEAQGTLGEAGALLEAAAVLQPFLSGSLRALLAPEDASVAALRAGLVELRGLEAQLAEAAERTTRWKEKLPQDEVAAALAQAKAVEAHPMRWFLPSWWRLKKVLQARYDFAGHAVAPAWSQVLGALEAEYALEGRRDAQLRVLRERFGVEDVVALGSQVERLHAPEAPSAVRELCDRARSGAVTAEALRALAGLRETLARLQQALAGVLLPLDALPLPAVPLALEGVGGALALVPRVLPLLAALRDAPALHGVLVARDWTPTQLEAALLLASVRRLHRSHPEAASLDGVQLGLVLERLSAGEVALRDLNASLISERAHAAFLEKVQRSSLPAAGLPLEEREWKKHFAKGRKELEHEFAKVMRHRSIRDLAEDADTRAVLAQLKPVWLMSPSSVADTLPFEQGFDVVIFDEASQIPLEESVPALYRAPQVIVVGDDKQLPPTDFFSSRGGDDEAGDPQGTEGPELQSGSLLTEAAGALPSQLLAWHYRSRSESLISFSNAAFYDRRLLTVPDCRTLGALTPIDAGAPSAETVLDRPVGFHLVPGAVYEKRTNPAEAEYVARLVKALLEKRSGVTLGIVAFSEAQQTTIERALEALAASDAGFRELYEAEQQREEDDQFCGLFVKNLENVQGDERDVILLSVCYGPDRRGKMLMNFGPINKRGGEKRLNVVFSRARRHMVVVSSILPGAITNDYNDGASCLKGYLAYAEAMSSGNAGAARRILGGLTAERDLSGSGHAGDPVLQSIAQALRARGLEAEVAVGDSGFRCDVAVRRPGEARYRLGILVDLGEGEDPQGILERGVLQPAVLGAFGWRVERVLAKDWQQRRSEVLERLLQAAA